ncbi:MAG: hypothetical protein ACXVXP_13850, partial [Mycobacteriaceae bacterium]
MQGTRQIFRGGGHLSEFAAAATAIWEAADSHRSWGAAQPEGAEPIKTEQPRLGQDVRADELACKPDPVTSAHLERL